MPRTAAPEGAKKLFIDDKVFTKIDKAVDEYLSEKKTSKKTGNFINLDASASNLANLIASRWASLKELSGIKPPVAKAPTKASKGKKEDAPVEKKTRAPRKLARSASSTAEV